MANVAAQQLADLQSATEQAQSEAANAAAAIVQQGGSAGQVSSSGRSDKEASFGVPEAIATGVVGTVLLGPIGGLLLGAAQGWLKKEAKQNVLDEQAKQNKALTETNAVLDGQYQDLLAGAVNANDQEQLNELKAKQDAGIKLMMSGNDDLAATGGNMFEQAQMGFTEYAKLQETQRIADEVRKEQLAADLTKQGADTYLGFLDDYDNQTQPFRDSTIYGNAALRSLESGNPYDIAQAVTGFVKLSDPTSIVSQGEQAGITGIGNAYDYIVGIAKKLEDGSSMTIGQRKKMAAAINTVMDSQQSGQRVTDLRFNDRLDNMNVPDKYYSSFQESKSVERYKPTDWQNVDTVAERSGEAIASPPPPASGGLRGAGSELMNLFRGTN